MSLSIASMTAAATSSDSRSPRTLVSVATYNELENLPLLVDEIFAVAPQVDLLVIDDNSPDGTGVWADERALRIRACMSCIARASWGSAPRPSRR